jgi:hypothetical protein
VVRSEVEAAHSSSSLHAPVLPTPVMLITIVFTFGSAHLSSVLAFHGGMMRFHWADKRCLCKSATERCSAGIHAGCGVCDEQCCLHMDSCGPGDCGCHSQQDCVFWCVFLIPSCAQQCQLNCLLMLVPSTDNAQHDSWQQSMGMCLHLWRLSVRHLMALNIT